MYEWILWLHLAAGIVWLGGMTLLLWAVRPAAIALLPLPAQQMRDLYFNRIFKQQQIAEIYGTRQGHVCQIISRQLWK